MYTSEVENNYLEQTEIKFEDRLYVENKEEWLKKCKNSYKIEGKTEVRTVDNGIILPLVRMGDSWDGIYGGGVCDSDFTFISGMCRNVNKPIFNYSCYCSYEVEREELKYSDETVIYGGVAINHFGHTMLECLSRLWWVIENPKSKYKIIFLSTVPGKSYIYPFAEMMGISKDRIVLLDSPTQFKKVIVPDETIHSQSGYRDKYMLPYNKIRENIEPSIHKKIYFTRSALARHDTVNEEYFEEFYRQRGFHVVSPEKLPIEEQIALAVGADEVACVLGTLSHFALFCKPGTKYTLLTRQYLNTLPAQMIINDASNVDYSIVDVSANFLPTKHTGGVFLLGPTRFWVDYLKDKNISFSEEEAYFRLEYFCYQYLLMWTNTYAKEKNFGSIKDFNIQHVVNTLRRVFPEETTKLPYKSNWKNSIPGMLSKVEELQSKDAILVKERDEYKKKFLDIQNSTIWKVTKPIRLVLDRFKGKK